LSLLATDDHDAQRRSGSLIVAGSFSVAAFCNATLMGHLGGGPAPAAGVGHAHALISSTRKIAPTSLLRIV